MTIRVTSTHDYSHYNLVSNALISLFYSYFGFYILTRFKLLRDLQNKRFRNLDGNSTWALYKESIMIVIYSCIAIYTIYIHNFSTIRESLLDMIVHRYNTRSNLKDLQTYKVEYCGGTNSDSIDESGFYALCYFTFLDDFTVETGIMLFAILSFVIYLNRRLKSLDFICDLVDFSIAIFFISLFIYSVLAYSYIMLDEIVSELNYYNFNIERLNSKASQNFTEGSETTEQSNDLWSSLFEVFVVILDILS